MRVRVALITGILALALAGIYVASPLLAAHKLREAIRSGDERTVRSMVEWSSLRASIKETVARNAQLLPIAAGVARNLKPTMWQRIRSMFGHSMLDRFIERYITPTGVSELYRAKNNWHARFAKPNTAVVQANIIPENLARAWRRIKKAKFVSPIRFVLEVEDRHKANRLIKSTFRLSSISLRGFDWKLITVSIRTLNPAKSHLAKMNGF